MGIKYVCIKIVCNWQQVTLLSCKDLQEAFVSSFRFSGHFCCQLPVNRDCVNQSVASVTGVASDIQRPSAGVAAAGAGSNIDPEFARRTTARPGGLRPRLNPSGRPSASLKPDLLACTTWLMFSASVSCLIVYEKPRWVRFAKNPFFASRCQRTPELAVASPK